MCNVSNVQAVSLNYYNMIKMLNKIQATAQF